MAPTTTEVRRSVAAAQLIRSDFLPPAKPQAPCTVSDSPMATPSAPDALVRFDLILDYDQWQQLKLEADRRGSDLGAYVSWLLMRQVHHQ